MEGKRFTYITHFNDCSDCPHRTFYCGDDDVDHDRCEKLNTYIRCYPYTGMEDYTNEDGVLKDCPYAKNYDNKDNLDEAAQEYAQKEYPDETSVGQFGTGDYQPPCNLSYKREEAMDDFKAGAMWNKTIMMKKLIKLKRLADNLYHAAQYLTNDAEGLHEKMKEYHNFITKEYYK